MSIKLIKPIISACGTAVLLTLLMLSQSGKVAGDEASNFERQLLIHRDDGLKFSIQDSDHSKKTYQINDLQYHWDDLTSEQQSKLIILEKRLFEAEGTLQRVEKEFDPTMVNLEVAALDHKMAVMERDVEVKRLEITTDRETTKKHTLVESIQALEKEVEETAETLAREEKIIRAVEKKLDKAAERFDETIKPIIDEMVSVLQQ